MRRFTPFTLLFLLMCIAFVGHATLSAQTPTDEPTIRLTTSAAVGTAYSFNIIGGGTNPIQIDWGDGNLVAPSSPMVRGQKAGPEIRVYGDCLAFLATNAQITAISINAPMMGMLSLADNELTSLDLSKTPSLESINLQNNQLTSLRVQSLEALSTLNVKQNKLETIELVGLNALRTLIISDNPNLKRIDAITLASLKSIRADNCDLEQISLPPNIEELYAKGGKLTSLGEGAVTFAKLKRLRLPNNQIETLSIGACPLLNDLELEGNKLTALTLGDLPALKTLYLQENQLTSKALNTIYNQLPTISGDIKVAGNPGAEAASGYIATEKGWTIDVLGKSNTDPDPYITIMTKPDRDIYLGLSGFAESSTVQIELDEGVVVEKTITNGVPPIEKYKSSRGMIKVIGLVHTIDCSENGSLSYDIDASTSPKLVKFYALHNTMSSVNLKGCTELTFVNCAGSELTELDLSDCTALETVWLPGNKFTSFDLTGLVRLQELSLERNQLTEIKGLSDCTKLTELNVAENTLSTLDLTGLTELNKLDCRENQLTSLDLSSCNALTEVYCYKNNIKAEPMKRLFETLPQRASGARGELFAMNSADNLEKNKVDESDVKIAEEKNWIVYDYKGGDKKPLANEAITSPASHRLTVEGGYVDITLATPHTAVTLYSIRGEELRSVRADSAGSVHLRVSDLPTGHYLLSIGAVTIKVML